MDHNSIYYYCISLFSVGKLLLSKLSNSLAFGIFHS